MEPEWDYRRKRLFEIIEIGLPGDVASQVYDAFNILSIVINLVVSVMYTFDDLHAKFGPWLVTVEAITVAFFALDYCLRLWTAKFLRPSLSEPKAVLRYIFSFSGLICCPSCPIICRCSSPAGRWPSACSGWPGCSACSG